MRTISYRGRNGKRQTRYVDGSGKFVKGRGKGRGRKMGNYDASWAMGLLDFDLPVVGPVNIPSRISFDFTQGVIGMAVGKVAPGLVYGILNRFAPNFSGYTKFLLGGLTGLTFLSAKYRNNSYLMGFALATFPDMIEPVIDGVMNLVLGTTPAVTAPAVAGMRRRLGALTPQEAIALNRAQALLGQGIPDAGFGGRDIMLPADYEALTRKPGMAGLNPSMVGAPGLRGIV